MKIKYAIGIICMMILQSGTLLSQTEMWEWGNPIPQGNELFDVCAISDSVVVAVGELGAVIKTMDFGGTWDVQQYAGYTNVALLAVDFFGPENGWCVGKNGVILASDDGGETWVRQNSPVPYHLYDIQFIDGENGWIVGRWGKVLQTQNGGESWEEKESGSLRALKAIQFVSNKVGYIAGSGGTVLRTTDGGENWQNLNTPFDVNLKSVSFVSDSVGMVAGDGGALFRTKDMGETWSQISYGVETDLYSVLMISDSITWILGYDTVFDSNGEMQLNPLTMKTVDGGQSWLNASNEDMPILNAVSFGASETIWCVGEGGAIFSAKVNGDDLELQTLVPVPFAFQIDFWDNDHGWMAGAKWVARTVDGGDSWDVVEIDSAYFLFAVEFVNADTGWAAGGEYIFTGNQPTIVADLYKSCDGGLTWRKQQLDNSQRIFDIQFVDSKTGFLVGEGGSLFKTSNWGDTWKKLNARTTNFLFDVHFFNDSTGIYCGSGGKIAKTVDGGAKWSNIRTGTSEVLFDLFFIDDTTGFAAGTGGTVLKTIDGGESWEIKETNAYDELWSIYFLTPRVGWAVGSNGVILKSMDYGETWEKLPQISTDTFTSIVVNKNGNGFIVGMSGTMLRTREGLTEVVSDPRKAVLQSFDLHQNYPNPFNASTKISFELNADSDVQLSLYDIRGRFIKDVHSGFYSAGKHTLTLDAEALPSGVYLYQLQVGALLQTRAMVLQK